MNKKLTRKTKKAIFIYFSVLISLFFIVEVLPKVTDIFETTQILKPDTLTLSCETEGYFIKDECVAIAPDSGEIKYLVPVGTVVKKGFDVVSIESDGDKKSNSKRFGEYLDKLKGYDGISQQNKSPLSGVFSLTIDGYEDYFTPDKMEKIKRSTVESLNCKPVNLERASVIEGEPVFKVSGDDIWYILCWMDKKDVENYPEGKSVILELQGGQVKANVYKVKPDGADFRVIFELDVYYEKFAESRKEKMTVVASDTSGLLVNNSALIKKKGVEGVYVVDKNGAYKFRPVKVVATDGKKSILKDVSFIDKKGYQVNTVKVYDEVLKHPKSALEKDLEKEEKEAEAKEEK